MVNELRAVVEELGGERILGRVLRTGLDRLQRAVQRTVEQIHFGGRGIRQIHQVTVTPGQHAQIRRVARRQRLSFRINFHSRRNVAALFRQRGPGQGIGEGEIFRPDKAGKKQRATKHAACPLQNGEIQSGSVYRRHV